MEGLASTPGTEAGAALVPGFSPEASFVFHPGLQASSALPPCSPQNVPGSREVGAGAPKALLAVGPLAPLTGADDFLTSPLIRTNREVFILSLKL